MAHYCRPEASDLLLKRIVNRGSFGVEIFFVLSGFLITHLLLREERNFGCISLRLFYLRRAVRLLPPLAVLVGALAVASAIGVMRIPAIDLLAGLLFFRNYVGTSPETGHLWTLAIEEQFYLLWPVGLLLVRNLRSRLAFTAAFVAASPLWAQWNYDAAGGAAHVNGWRTDLRLAPLTVGALLALLQAAPRPRRFLTHRLVCGGGTAAAAAAVLGLAFLTDLFDVRVVRAFVPTLTWACVAVVINALIADRRALLTRLMEMRAPVWLGTLSYSLYLWQQPFAPHVSETTQAWFRTFPVNLCFAFMLAVGSHYVVERPFLSIRKRLRRRSHDAETGAAAAGEA